MANQKSSTKTVRVTGRAHYEGNEVALRARRYTTKDGKPGVYITERQFKAAERKACITGDYLDLEDLRGYTNWNPDADGDYYALEG